MIALDACPVLAPQLVALLPPLGALLGRLDLARPGGELEATATTSGIDLQIMASDTPSLADREALAAFAAAQDLARIAWCPNEATPAEPIVQRRTPKIAFGQVEVALPPGAFLQASEAAEAAIRDAVDERDRRRRAHRRSVRRLRHAQPAARRGRAHGRMPSSAIRPCSRRWSRRRGAPGSRGASPPSGAICSARRWPAPSSPASMRSWSIRRAPARELRPRRLPPSRLARLALVSCNPATFARDARTLLDGGWRCLWVRPIDAFLWSSRIELVGAFDRPTTHG